MDIPIYKLVDVKKDFTMDGNILHILKGLSLEIKPREWLAMVGPSGSGKSTLLQLLGGLDRPTSGQIMLNGEDLATMSNRKLTKIRRNTIGFIFQSYHLFPELTAWENAVLPALYWGNDRKAAKERARRFLVNFGLEKRLNHRPRELSGGEQQRVAIARSLVNHPSIILADEPTGNLDRVAADDIVEILKSLRQEEQLTIVMVTHDPLLAAAADRSIKFAKSNS